MPSGASSSLFGFRFIFRWLFVPIRFLYILTRGGLFMLRWALSGRGGLGQFYQGLFNALGGTFIKAGQAMAMRQDLLPIEHCEALSTLMDQVPAFSSARAVRIIENDLGNPIPRLFASFETMPVAAASFSQVHKAVLHSGETVAVKVKRPGIEHIVFADTRIMMFIAGLFHFTGTWRNLRPLDVAREVNDVLWDELNYEREGRFLKIFRIHEELIPWLKVPHHFPAHSGPRVITMTFLDGKPLREAISQMRNEPNAEIRLSNGETVDLPLAGKRIYELTMRSVFEIGCFHADLHHGNILLMEDGCIGLIDFGIVGVLSRELKEKNFHYIDALCSGDIEKAADIFTTIVSPGPSADKAALKREMIIELQFWKASAGDPKASFQDKSSATVLNHSVDFARRYGFLLPRNTVLYYKTILNIDHINIEVNPSYDGLREGEQYVKEFKWRMAEKELDPDKLMRKLYRAYEFVSGLPEMLEGLQKMVAERNQGGRAGLTPWVIGSFLTTAGLLGMACGVALFFLEHTGWTTEMKILIAVAALISGFQFVRAGRSLSRSYDS